MSDDLIEINSNADLVKKRQHCVECRADAERIKIACGGEWMDSALRDFAADMDRIIPIIDQLLKRATLDKKSALFKKFLKIDEHAMLMHHLHKEAFKVNMEERR